MKKNRKRLVVVLGMHRSGTSTLTRALTALGISLGDNLMPAVNDVNSKGFFEDLDINSLNIEMLQALGSDWDRLARVNSNDVERLIQQGYLQRALELLRQKTGDEKVFGFKDPRVAKLLPFWKKVFAKGEFAVCYILALRNPFSVAKSLSKRDGFEREKSYLLWLDHVLTSLALTESSKRVLVDYDQLLEYSAREVELIAKRLGFHVDYQELAAYQNDFLEENLRHTVATTEDLMSDQACPPLVREIYTRLSTVFEDNNLLDAPEFHKLVAEWLIEFQRSSYKLLFIDNLYKKIGVFNHTFIDQEHKLQVLFKELVSYDKSMLRDGFDSAWYLTEYPDVAKSSIDPYEHYICSGIFEGKYPSVNLVSTITKALPIWFQGTNSRINSTVLSLEKLPLQISEFEAGLNGRLSEWHGTHEQKYNDIARESAEHQSAVSNKFEYLSHQLELQREYLMNNQREFSERLSEVLNQHKQNEKERRLEYAELLAELRAEFAGRENELKATLLQASQKIEMQKQFIENREAEFTAKQAALNSQICQSAIKIKELSSAMAEAEIKSTATHDELKREFHEKLQILTEKNASVVKFYSVQNAEKQAEVDKLMLKISEIETNNSIVVDQLKSELSAIRDSFSWRLLKPFRRITGPGKA